MGVQFKFHDWFSETLIRDVISLKEGVFSFGANKGKDHSKVNTSYLQWVLANVNNPRLLGPEFRAEIQKEIARREGGSAAPAKAASPPSPKPAVPQAIWVKAKAIATGYGLRAGQDAALTKRPDGNWDYLTLDDYKRTGTIPAKDVAGTVQSLKNDDGQPITAPDPNVWMPKRGGDVKDTSKKEEKPKILPDDWMPPGSEQRAIDDRFKMMMENPGQSHMMISANAGSGKTTMLQHLAWKYGKMGEKWLYLVFNTKNRVEGKEKFPAWVDVQTTNSFLGHLLRDKENITRIPQTELMATLSQKRKGDSEDEDSGKIVEKARVIADSPEFTQILQNSGLPDSGYAEVADNEYEKKALESILKSMRYTFKESVLTLLGLTKSYAVDPRKEQFEQNIDDIMNKYDIDTALEDIKERIQKYPPSFATGIKYHLKNILGYDFMQKDYREEIKKATIWMLHETLPHATGQKYKKGQLEYELGQFRDFNDDLWFAAAHADELQWPHYDVVLADEVQDFNEAQKILMKKLHDSGAKIVAVGDKNQSLYRFRGADSDAFDNLGNMLTNLSNDKDVTKRLTKNYRSRPAILDYVNQKTHVKDMVQGKNFNDDYKGTVTDDDLHYDDAFKTLNAEKASGAIKETAFISRTNEPLVHAALQLLGSGIPFVIVGRDVARDLMRHINRVLRMNRIGDADPVQNLQRQLQSHLTSEQGRFSTHSTKKNYLKELGDTTLALTSAIGQFAPQNVNPYQPQKKSVGEFKKWLQEKLGGYDVQENEGDLAAFNEKVKKEKPVILTTAHKSKGLEFERVYLLRKDQFPHPRAKRHEDKQQEENAKFVALSRAISELHVLKTKGQPGAKD